MTVKSKTVIQDVAKAKELVLNVGRAFRKIEKETVVNNLDERTSRSTAGSPTASNAPSVSRRWP